MRAAILTCQKKPLKIANIKLPKELSYGQVLVKIFYSGICGSQLSEIDGLRGPDNNIPHLLGHEASGEVLKIGKGVSSVKKGDLVVLHYMRNNKIESDTPKYLWNKKIVSSGGVSTFSEMSIVSENRITKIPKNYDRKLAALFGCAITTAFGVINHDSSLKNGQSIIILGLGGIGLLIAKSAYLSSAYPIIGIDIKKKKLELGKKFGVTYGLLNKKNIKDKLEKILSYSKGKADLVVEATGNPNMIELAYSLAKNDGEIVLCGQPKRTAEVKFPILPENYKKKLKISLGGSAIPQADIANYIRLFNSRKIDIKKIITHQFPLEKINKAISVLRSGNAGRVLIKM